jgi:hypothetical protein
MTRFFVTLSVVIAIAAWADAQHAPIASDHAKTFAANRALVANMIEHTVDLAGTSDDLTRAEACHRVMSDLCHAMTLAVSNQESGRVAELGGHIATVVNTALVPSLISARERIAETSEHYLTLKSLHAKANSDLTSIRASIPELGALGTSNAVKEMLGQLRAATSALELSLLPKTAAP